MKTQRKMVKKKLKGQEYRRKNVEIRPVVFILCNKALKRKIGILKYIYLEILTLFSCFFFKSRNYIICVHLIKQNLLKLIKL